MVPTELADGLGPGSDRGRWLPIAVRPGPGPRRGVRILRINPQEGRLI